MPPTKPYNEYKVGEVVQHNYKFFGDCFDPSNGPFRDWFFAGSTTEDDVRAKLKAYQLDIPVGIKLVVVDLQNQRHLAGKIPGARLKKAQRRRIGITAGADGQPVMIVRIIGWRVGRKTPRWPMLKALVHGQNNHFPAAG